MSDISKKPTHTAYTVRPGKSETNKGFWTRIGSVWTHKDSDGFTVRLDALPVNGELVIRTKAPEDAETAS